MVVSIVIGTGEKLCEPLLVGLAQLFPQQVFREESSGFRDSQEVIVKLVCILSLLASANGRNALSSSGILIAEKIMFLYVLHADHAALLSHRNLFVPNG